MWDLTETKVLADNPQPLERVNLERRHTHTHEASWLLKLACCITRMVGISSRDQGSGEDSANSVPLGESVRTPATAAEHRAPYPRATEDSR